MLRPDRTPRGEDPMLLPKMIIFVLAAVVAISGMIMQRPWVIFSAILILAIGFLLRFIRPPRRPDDGEGE